VRYFFRCKCYISGAFVGPLCDRSHRIRCVADDVLLRTMVVRAVVRVDCSVVLLQLWKRPKSLRRESEEKECETGPK
jgi:hypothetical protein